MQIAAKTCLFRLKLDVTNAGNTPALDAFVIAVPFFGEAIPQAAIEVRDKLIGLPIGERPDNVFAGETMTRTILVNSHADDGYNGLPLVGLATAIVAVRYHTIFDKIGDEPHVTLRVYDLSNTPGGLLNPSYSMNREKLRLEPNIIVSGYVT